METVSNSGAQGRATVEAPRATEVVEPVESSKTEQRDRAARALFPGRPVERRLIYADAGPAEKGA